MLLYWLVGHIEGGLPEGLHLCTGSRVVYRHIVMFAYLTLPFVYLCVKTTGLGGSLLPADADKHLPEVRLMPGLRKQKQKGFPLADLND
jgi:hypothetical protein